MSLKAFLRALPGKLKRIALRITDSRLYAVFVWSLLLLALTFMAAWKFSPLMETPKVVVQTVEIPHEGRRLFGCRVKRLGGGNSKQVQALLIASAGRGPDLAPEPPIPDGSLPHYKPSAGGSNRQAALPLLSLAVGDGLIWPVAPATEGITAPDCRLIPYTPDGCERVIFEQETSALAAPVNWLIGHQWLVLFVLALSIIPAGERMFKHYKLMPPKS